MKKLWKTLIVTLCCVMMLSLVGAVACTKKATKPTVGKITGVVMDEKGNPLEGAEVYYAVPGDDEDEDEDNVISVETDEDGKFELEEVAIGNLTLNSTLLGYTDWNKDITEANFDNDGLYNLNIVMEEGKGTVTGTVVMNGHSNVKVENADIKVAGTGIAAKTNANGEFTLNDVPMLGTKTLNISCDGYVPTTATVTTRQYKNNTVKLTTINLVQSDVPGFTGFKPYNLQKEPIDANKLVIESNQIDTYFEKSANNLYGSSKIETHSEGYCLNADNGGQAYDNMAVFISAKVLVDANHKYITVNAATFEGQNNESNVGGAGVRAALGLYVFHAKAEGSTKVSPTDYELDNNVYGFEVVTAYNPTFQAVQFDISRYDGQEIVLVIGSKVGYHCVVKNIQFSAEPPEYISPEGVKGLGQLLVNRTDKDEFDGYTIQDNWTIGGAADKANNDEKDIHGITLNCKDPWKAWYYDDERNDGSINSYIYVTKNITDANSTLKYTATLINISECLDPGNANDQGPYYPYLKALAIDADGNVVAQSDWSSPWTLLSEVTDENKTIDFTVDLSKAAGKEVTIVIACNVGYKATITNVAFTAAEAE